MNGETKEIKTKSGVVVVLKTYLTGREMRELRDIFLRNAEMKTEGDTTKIEGLKGSIVTEVENKAIELAVVSLNGENENILESVLDLPAEDYEEIITEVNKISAFGAFAEKKRQ